MQRPNLIFVLTDDQRWDALGCVNPLAQTPTMDALAARGVRFSQACVTTSICSPSRACCLTGRYGSATGVTGLTAPTLREGEQLVSTLLRQSGYRTGYVGKWHLDRPATPAEADFDRHTWFKSNGPHYGRQVTEQGRQRKVAGFIEDYLADQSVRFIEGAARDNQPFFLHLASQVPHMNDKFEWVPQPETLERFDPAAIPLPPNWRDDLAGKPPYLLTGRHRLKAAEYGYDTAEGVRRHWRAYLAEIHELDRSLGRVVAAVDRLGLRDNTWIILMGDNGWFMGEHGFTSKVLAYEESMRVPLVVAGPGLMGQVRDEPVLNADIAPSLLDLAGVDAPPAVHGRSLRPLLAGRAEGWRERVYYEALQPELGSWPLVAVRDRRHKYIRTYPIDRPGQVAFEELYDLTADPGELRNLASDPAQADRLTAMRAELDRLRAEVAAGRPV